MEICCAFEGWKVFPVAMVEATNVGIWTVEEFQIQ